MNDKPDQANPNHPEKTENLKIILMAFLWLVFFALSFVTYFAIPAVLLVTWAVIAWFVKARKGDQDSGSGYDREF
jgi:fatty acid desaturase